MLFIGSVIYLCFLAVFLGFGTKFLEFKVERNLLLIARVMLMALFAPAIFEEFFSRFAFTSSFRK